MIFMFGNDVTVMVNLFELAAVDTPYAVSFQKYEGKRYCISESLSINNAAAGGDWIRNERPTQAMLMPVRIGAGATWGWGLGSIGSAARGSECKKIRERPAKGSIRIQASTTAASAASPSLMGSNNNFGGIAEFAAKK